MAKTTSESTLEELKALLAEAEKALSQPAGDEVSDEIDALRTRLRSALEQGKVSARHAVEVAKEKATQADQAIRTHPYVAIGIAAAVGLLAGVIISRGSSNR